MKHLLARSGVLALTAGLLVITPSVAQAETEVVVFKDQVTQPDTRATGSVTWPVGGGIRMRTQGATSTDKATFVFPTGTNAFDLGAAAIGHDVNTKPGGPQAEPGVQVYGDTDDDGTPDALWVWETVYQAGGSDIWLTNASPAAVKRAAPSCDGSDAVANATTAAQRDALYANGHCTSGSGSPWHGSESAWSAALTAASLDDQVVGLGESLGSGVFGNVLVTSINAGDTFWTFSRTNAPAPEPVVVDPATRVQVTVSTSCRQAVFTATLPAPGANEVYSQARVGFKFVEAGTTVLRSTVGVGETQSRTVTYTRSNTNVPRVKTFRTANGQAATAAPNVLVEDEGVDRRCDVVGG